MTVTFTIRDKDTGNFVLGLTDRITRILGRITILSAPGSFVIPLEDGEPFFYVPSTAEPDGARVPTITRDGRTLSWPSLASMGQYENPNSVNFDIVYGYT